MFIVLLFSDLMNTRSVVPDWLLDLLMGYLDPAAAHYSRRPDFYEPDRTGSTPSSPRTICALPSHSTTSSSPIRARITNKRVNQWVSFQFTQG